MPQVHGQVTTRAEFFGKKEEPIDLVEDEEGVQFLHGVLERSLVYDLERLPKRRRVGEVEEYRYVTEEPQGVFFEVKCSTRIEHGAVFRLVSSGPVSLISLQPPPPPPSITREPACEDTEEGAALREKRAKETAVDADWVLRQSKPISKVRLVCPSGMASLIQSLARLQINIHSFSQAPQTVSSSPCRLDSPSTPSSASTDRRSSLHIPLQPHRHSTSNRVESQMPSRPRQIHCQAISFKTEKKCRESSAGILET
mgnify:CR=1 FL=1